MRWSVVTASVAVGEEGGPGSSFWRWVPDVVWSMMMMLSSSDRASCACALARDYLLPDWKGNYNKSFIQLFKTGFLCTSQIRCPTTAILRIGKFGLLKSTEKSDLFESCPASRFSWSRLIQTARKSTSFGPTIKYVEYGPLLCVGSLTLWAVASQSPNLGLQMGQSKCVRGRHLHPGQLQPKIIVLYPRASSKVQNSPFSDSAAALEVEDTPRNRSLRKPVITYGHCFATSPSN